MFVYGRETFTYKRNTEGQSLKQCYHGKAISITDSECVSIASIIQHAKCMRHRVPSVACPDVQKFYIISHQRQDLGKKKLFIIKCVLNFFTTFA